MAQRKRMSKADRREVIELAAIEVFARRGYRGASMGEIAERSGVTVPVVYDHFASKLDLYKHLLERVRNELLEMWGKELFGDDPPEVRIPRSLVAWAAYVEGHRDAASMYYRDVSGDDDAEAAHKEIKDQARVALGALLGALVPGRSQIELEMAAEIIRAGLVGLALWWNDHPHVAAEQIVEVGNEVLWGGYLSAAGQTMR
jgi:AcrR family transcriptional regulator